MNKELTFEQIKEQFSNPDWTSELLSNCYLEPSDKAKSIKYIINQLASRDSSIRYIASLMIIRFDIQDAVEPLIGRILDKDTKNSNGTMAFALEDLNCENHLVRIFEILATQSYESKCHAYNILSEQEFIFMKEDIHEMKRILNNVEQNQEENQIFDNETLEMIKDSYEGFEQYLIESERK